MAFSVPVPVRPALIRIATIDDGTFDRMLGVLSAMPTIINPKDVTRYAKEHESEVSSDVLIDIAQAGISLAYGRTTSDLDTAAFVEQVLKSARDLAEIASANLDYGLLGARLTELLSVSSLGIAAKAATVSFETVRHMTGARILTDIRPVFGKAVSDDPLTCLILHHLKIEYHEGSADIESFFVALDVDDLKMLREAISRALEKEERLRDLLRSTGVNLVGFVGKPDKAKEG